MTNDTTSPGKTGREILEAFADALEAVPVTDPAWELCLKLAAWLRSTVDPDPGKKDPPDGTDDHGPKPLTNRECEVLNMIALGMSNKTIAAEMLVTEKTVKTHANHIYKKLGVASRTQAAVLVVRGDAPAVPSTAERARRRSPRYDVRELLYRPLEHVLEDLTCRVLGEAIGLGHTAAWEVKRGLRPLEEHEAVALRRWLASHCEAA